STGDAGEGEAPGESRGHLPISSLAADPLPHADINKDVCRRRLPDDAEEPSIISQSPSGALPVNLSHEPDMRENWKFHDHPPASERVCLGPLSPPAKVQVISERKKLSAHYANSFEAEPPLASGSRREERPNLNSKANAVFVL